MKISYESDLAGMFTGGICKKWIPKRLEAVDTTVHISRPKKAKGQIRINGSRYGSRSHLQSGARGRRSNLAADVFHDDPGQVRIDLRRQHLLLVLAHGPCPPAIRAAVPR